ncbi:MAG: flagellar hook-basal body complex protein, partial [Burkholderiaceae bacterium]
AEPAGTVSTWEIYGSFNGNMLNPGPPPTSFGSLNFDGAGAMVGSAVLTMPDLVPSNGANTITGLPLDMSGSSQFASTFGVSKLSQDGFGPGRVTGLSISPDGVVLSRYSNGQSRASGQVVLASFANLQGLANIGANSWVETPQSGQPTVGVPKSSNLGALQSGSLEDANVDITAELVNMITAQRVYQANAQTIKTQDQVLQTLVNLR